MKAPLGWSERVALMLADVMGTLNPLLVVIPPEVELIGVRALARADD